MGIGVVDSTQTDLSGYEQVGSDDTGLEGYEQVNQTENLEGYEQVGNIRQILTKAEDAKRSGVVSLPGIRQLTLPEQRLNMPTVSTMVESTRISGVSRDNPQRELFQTFNEDEGRPVFDDLKEGVVHLISAVGNAARMIPLVDPRRPLEKVLLPEVTEFRDAQAAAIADNISQWAQSGVQFEPETGRFAKPPENFLDYIEPRRIVKVAAKGIPLMGALIGTTMLSPVAGTALMVGIEGGGTRKALEELERSGQAVDPFYKDVAPVVVGVFNAALERLGINKILSVNKVPGIKSRILGIVSSAFIEGGTEGLQEINQVLAEVGSGKRLNPQDWERVKGSIYAGLVLGTTASTTVGGIGAVSEFVESDRARREADRVSLEMKNIVRDSEFAARKVAEVRGEELGDVAEEFDIDIGTNVRPLTKLSDAERRVVREAELGGLPPTIGVEGRQTEVKPDIKVRFLDEEIVEANKPVEMYEMDIGGVKSEFFVSRVKGENVREKMNEQLELYTDPIQPGEVRNPAAEALANKNFGLQKKLNEKYHEWVRGEVKEKMRKEFEGSVVVDGDGNPIKVRQINKTTFTEDLGNNPVDKFVFLKTENPIVDVDENGSRTWTINEGDKTVDAFESFIKHREKVIKNQPPPPNVSGRDMTFQQLLEILPRRFGGKWPNDKPIVDVFAETTQPEVLSDLVLAKEQALNKILPNIQAYNKFIDNYRTYQKPVSRRIKESNKALDKLRVWVADTGLLFASKLGKAGGSVMQLAIDGHNKEVELYKIAGFHREKLVDIYKKADWNELKRDMVDVSIVNALEDRTNAKSYFTDKDGVLDEDAFEIYKIMQNHFDVMEKHVTASGRGTIENYFTRAVERMSALDQLLSGLESNDFVSVQDALRGKVDSPFLKERKGELEKYRHDVLQVFDIYNSSVIKTLAYEDLVKYYTSTFQKSSEGAFGADVPPELAGTPSFYKMRTEVNKWMRGLVEPEYMYGPVGKFMMKVRRNMYETFLSWNLRAGLDNSTQDMFILAFTPAETHSIYRNVYKQRRRFDKEAPLLAEALKQAGKDKTYLLELAESDLGRFDKSQKKKTGVRYAMSKVSELDPFYMWERANWAKAEVAGLVEYAWKQPGWNDAVVRHKGDHVKAVEDILSSQPIHQRRSVVSARQLSWQTQFMAGNVASPHIFRTELGKFLGMFKRFSFGQVENMIRSFQQSGTDGIAAVRILARGFPDEVQHVETLRSVETLRKGIEAVEDLARKHPEEVDVDLRAVSMMRKSVVEMEKDLNGIIKRLQPINKNNKSTQVRLWARYAAKRWAYAFLFNTMASMVLDFLGFGMSDAFKSQDPLERAVSAASRNLVPFFWEVRNPSRLVASPIIPDTGGAFGGKRQYLKGMVEWGFNSVKYAGVVNRLTNRMLSNFVTDLTFPVVEAITPGESKKRKKSKL